MARKTANAAQALSDRARDLPILLQRLALLIVADLQGRTDGNFFADCYIREYAPLRRRVASGERSEEYAAVYAEELNFLKAVFDACEEAKTGRLGCEDLNARVEACVRRYLRTDAPRSARFTL